MLYKIYMKERKKKKKKKKKKDLENRQKYI